jgi:glycosyltransferase involved in cell wall biosynthesis
VGDPERPGHEAREALHLHRWCQWLSAHHPAGVYDGEEGKQRDFDASLPPFLLREVLAPHLRAGGRAVVLAEEWHTAGAVLHLDALLRAEGLREQALLFWNANNTFGFERIDWKRLSAAARITTVIRYMRRCMEPLGVQPLVIPNGLRPECFESPERSAVAALRGRLRGRVLLAKIARFDPDKRWIPSIELVAEMKRRGLAPLLVARGGLERHGDEVWERSRALGLRVVERTLRRPGAEGMLEALGVLASADVVNLRSHVDTEARRVLLRAADAVLANSGHEPFGLVGLETMAAGGVACTGNSGEDYAVAGHNALVLETSDPREFLGFYARLRAQPERERALRRAGRATARSYAWQQVLDRVLFPRLEILA